MSSTVKTSGIPQAYLSESKPRSYTPFDIDIPTSTPIPTALWCKRKHAPSPPTRSQILIRSSHRLLRDFPVSPAPSTSPCTIRSSQTTISTRPRLSPNISPYHHTNSHRVTKDTALAPVRRHLTVRELCIASPLRSPAQHSQTPPMRHRARILSANLTRRCTHLTIRELCISASPCRLGDEQKGTRLEARRAVLEQGLRAEYARELEGKRESGEWWREWEERHADEVERGQKCDDEEPPGSSFTLLEAAQEGVVQPVPTRAEHQWRRSVDLLEFVAGHWGLAASV